MKAIPKKFLDNLELKDVILEIADDLFNDCKISEYGSYRDEIWEQKYIYKTYKPKLVHASPEENYMKSPWNTYDYKNSREFAIWDR